MNKTIIININGTVFHIEENAYEILKQYMTAVKRHFFNSADSLEITTDIENRIAELLTELLARDGRQAVVEQDVNYVIQQMGAVEDFDSPSAEGETTGAYFYQEPASSRRLFRDPDNHLIAGVCSGIANYFDIQTVWVRLAFVIVSIFAGTGLFVYLILWLVIPKAVTRMDRMAMRGEKLNLEGFKKNFEDELNNVRGKVADMHSEAQPFIYRFRDFVQEFFSFVGSAIRTLGSWILKLLGLACLLFAFGFAVVLIVTLVSFIGFGNELHYIFPFSVIGYQYQTWIYITAFVALMVPLVAIIIVASKALFNTPAITRPIGSTLFVVWIASVSTLVYFAAKISANFRERASFDKTISLRPTANNVYHLEMNNAKFLTAEDSARLDLQSRFHGLVVTNDDDDMEDGPENVWINIEKSDVAQPVIIERYHAEGRTYENALLNARNTAYSFTQQDSVLKFDYRLHRLKNEPWHNERIDITVKLPLNATVVIDRGMQHYTNAGIYDCINTNKRDNATSARFTMTTNGLECKVDTLKSELISDTVHINRNNDRQNIPADRKATKDTALIAH